MKVTIEAINAPEYWKVGGTTAKLRIEALQGFTTSLGQFVPPSNNGSFYLEVPITIIADIPVISAFEIDSTEDASPWNSIITGDVPGYKATIITNKGRKFPYLAQFKVATLPVGDPSYTWGEVRIFNQAVARSAIRSPRYFSEDQVNTLIGLAVADLNKSSTTNTGVVALSADPLDVSFPIAVGTNDPIWVDLSTDSPVTPGSYTAASITVDSRGRVTAASSNIVIGGSVGVTDNRVPRSDGTGGLTLQASSVTITDDGNVGIGTDDPIFNDDGTTGANVGRWLAVDGTAAGSGFAGYFGVGGTIPGVNDRVGLINFFNYSMGGVDHRTAHIASFNDGALGRGSLSFSTAPNNIGALQRMEISYTGEVGIGFAASRNSNVRLQLAGMGATSATFSMILLNNSGVPQNLFRDDGKVFIATTDPNSVVAPASNGIFTVGQTGQFSVTSTGDALQRSIQLVGGTRPAANAANRGMFWYVPGGAGVADTLEACRKDAADVYAWVSLI